MLQPEYIYILWCTKSKIPQLCYSQFCKSILKMATLILKKRGGKAPIWNVKIYNLNYGPPAVSCQKSTSSATICPQRCCLSKAGHISQLRKFSVQKMNLVNICWKQVSSYVSPAYISSIIRHCWRICAYQLQPSYFFQIKTIWQPVRNKFCHYWKSRGYHNNRPKITVPTAFFLEKQTSWRLRRIISNATWAYTSSQVFCELVPLTVQFYMSL